MGVAKTKKPGTSPGRYAAIVSLNVSLVTLLHVLSHDHVLIIF